MPDMLELRSRIDALRARWQTAKLRDAVRRPVGRLAGPLPAPSAAMSALGRAIAPLVRRYRILLRGSHRQVVYHDGRITLDDEGVTLHGYYIPFGRKRISYRAIRGVYQWPVTGARAYRIHGPGWGRVWYPRDPRRAERSVGILLDIGTWLRPLLTPDDPYKVLALLEHRVG